MDEQVGAEVALEAGQGGPEGEAGVEVDSPGQCRSMIRRKQLEKGNGVQLVKEHVCGVSHITPCTLGFDKEGCGFG